MVRNKCKLSEHSPQSFFVMASSCIAKFTCDAFIMTTRYKLSWLFLISMILFHQDPIDVLSIDNEEVRSSQVAKLKQVRADRDEAKAAAALQALNELAAKQGINNSIAEQNLVTTGLPTIAEVLPRFVVSTSAVLAT